jgi:hypothetical protein
VGEAAGALDAVGVGAVALVAADTEGSSSGEGDEPAWLTADAASDAGVAVLASERRTNCSGFTSFQWPFGRDRLIASVSSGPEDEWRSAGLGIEGLGTVRAFKQFGQAVAIGVKSRDPVPLWPRLNPAANAIAAHVWESRELSRRLNDTGSWLARRPGEQD